MAGLLFCAFRHMFFPIPYGVMRPPVRGGALIVAPLILNLMVLNWESGIFEIGLEIWMMQMS